MGLSCPTLQGHQTIPGGPQAVTWEDRDYDNILPSSLCQERGMAQGDQNPE